MTHDRRAKAFVARAKATDVPGLARRLREEDKQECLALGCEPLDALRESYKASAMCFSIIDQDNVIGMFGVAPCPWVSTDTLKVGSVWLLGSPGIQDIRFTFLRQCSHWVDQMHAQFPVMWNWADCRNDLHLKWLRWLGFKTIGTHAIGVNGENFHQFISVRNK